MREAYEIAVLQFFAGKPVEQTLYEAFAAKVLDAFPKAAVRVQKSQITFSGRHNFAFTSLPIRRKKGWPKHCMIVTFGLYSKLESQRIAAAVEPYPNHWTHHVVVSDVSELDEQLMGWVSEAHACAESKR